MTVIREYTLTIPLDDPRHGTANGYRNHNCRCDACRAAHAALVMATSRQRPPLAPDDPRHGTTNGYQNFRCRCDACRAAHSRQQASHRAWKRATP